MYMEISAMIPALTAQAQLPIDIGTAVLDMSLENLETMSDGMKRIMELSVNPGLGANIDISV